MFTEYFRLAGLGPGDRISLAQLGTSFRPWVIEFGSELVLAPENTYFCPNPVKPGVAGKPKASDIADTRVLLLDIDPDGETDCVGELRRIADVVEARYGARPTIVDSGRGAQGWLFMGPSGRAELLAALRRELRPGYKLDGTHNPDRLMRLPGTTNYRTGRPVVVLEPGRGRVVWTEPAASPAPWLPPRAQAAWDLVEPDRSKKDALFVLACLESGLATDKTRELLRQLPGGKDSEDKRGESYWQSTLKWARGRLESAKADMAAMSALAAENAATAEAGDGILRFVQLDKWKSKWFRRSGTEWVPISETAAKACMKALDLDAAQCYLDATAKPWKIVYEPFQPEILPGKRWNHGAQLIKPEPGEFGTWTRALAHIGQNLTPYVVEDPWCQAAGLSTGGDWLRAWAASMIQEPREPTPYLFLYGDERCGKSMLHEMLALLFVGGVCDGARALKGNFNGELAGAVLVYVEEVDVNDKRNRATKENIKKWVTGPLLDVHAKGRDLFMTPNCTHWIQAANSPNFCPVFPGDTRIVTWSVLEPENREPKKVLMDRLRAEAPAFLAALLAQYLPPSPERLRVPVLGTADKARMQEANKGPVARWVESTPEWYCLSDDEAFAAFRLSVGLAEEQEWTRSKFLSELPTGARQVRDIWRTVKDRPGEYTTSELFEAFPQFGKEFGGVVHFGRVLSKVTKIVTREVAGVAKRYIPAGKR